MTYNDPSHLPKTNPIDQSKVDALSKEISKWLQTKMYGVDVRTALAWAVEHFSAMHYDEHTLVLAIQRVVEEYKQHFDQTTAEFNQNWQNQLDEWNRIIAGTTTDTEIKDARVDRNGNQYATLKERLDASQTVEYANTQEVIDGYFSNKAVSPKALKDALPTIANAVIGLDDKIQSKINQNNSYIMFVGTQAQWDALPQTEKAKYILRAVTE